MIVDNFKLIEKHLTFDSPDEFYFVQVLMRGKDGNTQVGINGNNKNRQIAFYCITSKEKLEEKKEEIITLCKTKNARCYIHPTKRSFKQVAIKALVLTADIIEKENYMGMKGVYSTACGQSFITKDKKFVVDIDRNENENDERLNERTEEMMAYINAECEPLGYKKIFYTIPTKNGLHLITKPFNTERFKSEYPTIDIHKNNPTLLYYNSDLLLTEIPLLTNINGVHEYLTAEEDLMPWEQYKVIVELINGATTRGFVDYEPYGETSDFEDIKTRMPIEQSDIAKIWTLDKTKLLWKR